MREDTCPPQTLPQYPNTTIPAIPNTKPWYEIPSPIVNISLVRKGRRYMTQYYELSQCQEQILIPNTISTNTDPRYNISVQNTILIKISLVRRRKRNFSTLITLLLSQNYVPDDQFYCSSPCLWHTANQHHKSWVGFKQKKPSGECIKFPFPCLV